MDLHQLVAHQEEEFVKSSYHEKIRVDGEVLPVATADIGDNAAGGKGAEELRDSGPGGVSRRTEVMRYLLVDLATQGTFVLSSSLIFFVLSLSCRLSRSSL